MRPRTIASTLTKELTIDRKTGELSAPVSTAISPMYATIRIKPTAPSFIGRTKPLDCATTCDSMAHLSYPPPTTLWKSKWPEKLFVVCGTKLCGEHLYGHFSTATWTWNPCYTAPLIWSRLRPHTSVVESPTRSDEDVALEWRDLERRRTHF